LTELVHGWLQARQAASIRSSLAAPIDAALPDIIAREVGGWSADDAAACAGPTIASRAAVRLVRSSPTRTSP